MQALNRTWLERGQGREDDAPDGTAVPDAAAGVRRARERVWVADTACYYAHRRFLQSGTTADREAWEARLRECVAAVEALRRAERLQAHIPGR